MNNEKSGLIIGITSCILAFTYMYFANLPTLSIPYLPVLILLNSLGFGLGLMGRCD